MSTFVISDTRFCEDWKERGFDSEQSLNEYLIRQWNSVVKQEDTVYVLGNFGKGHIRIIQTILHLLNGKIILFYNDTVSQYNRQLWIHIGCEDAIHYTLYSSDKKIHFNYNKENVCKPIEQDWLICYGGTSSVWSEEGLNVNASYWDYCPINIEEVRQIWSRLKSFGEEQI